MGKKSAAAKLGATPSRDDTTVDETDVGTFNPPTLAAVDASKPLSFVEAPVAFVWSRIPFRWEALSFFVCLATR
jgi:hypothetical protein